MAIEVLHKARAVRPMNTIVLNRSAMVLDGVGRKPAAREKLTLRMLQVDPNACGGDEQLRLLLAETGEDSGLGSEDGRAGASHSTPGNGRRSRRCSAGLDGKKGMGLIELSKSCATWRTRSGALHDHYHGLRIMN